MRPSDPLYKFLHRLTGIAVLALVGLAASPAMAHYRETCFVKYSIYSDGMSRYTDEWTQYSSGWSQVFAAECNYLTGWELNTRTHRRGFTDEKIYVLIAWPGYEPSVIRLSESHFCGQVAETGCAERVSGRLHGRDDWHDEYGRLIQRSWRICQPGFFGRDCYRILR